MFLWKKYTSSSHFPLRCSFPSSIPIVPPDVHVLAVEYPGYGLAAGQPNEESVDAPGPFQFSEFLSNKFFCYRNWNTEGAHCGQKLRFFGKILSDCSHWAFCLQKVGINIQFMLIWIWMSEFKRAGNRLLKFLVEKVKKKLWWLQKCIQSTLHEKLSEERIKTGWVYF